MKRLCINAGLILFWWLVTFTLVAQTSVPPHIPPPGYSWMPIDTAAGIQYQLVPGESQSTNPPAWVIVVPETEPVEPESVTISRLSNSKVYTIQQGETVVTCFAGALAVTCY